jgi:hypothetical protein
MKIIERIFDVTTNQTTDIERDATPDEIAQAQALELAAQQKAEQDAAKAAAKQTLLDKLGITQEEAQLLLGGN